MSRLSTYLSFVRFSHSVFALPFALTGALLAWRQQPFSWGQVLWIVVCMVSARSAAMGFNRLVDARFDAMNPRTSMRELPRGAMSMTEAALFVAVSSIVFVYGASRLSTLCLILSPVALAWIMFYSYTKRFTRWSHLVLGWSLAIAPVGGYLAVTGTWSRPTWMLLALALGVASWVAGFDVFYALQDVEFDRAERLKSLPAVIGEARSIRVARLLHGTSVAALATVGFAIAGGPWYWVGVSLAALLLVYEHSLVQPGNLSRLDAAFFTMNGMISIAFFFFVLLDRLTRVSAFGARLP